MVASLGLKGSRLARDLEGLKTEYPSAIRDSIGGLTSGVLNVPGMELESLHPR